MNQTPQAPLESFAKWMKKNLFSTPVNSIITILIISLFFKVLGPIVDWFFINSVWEGDAATCRQADGACLAFIREKFLFILFGFFPREEIWRVLVALFIFIGSVLYSKEIHRWNKKLLAVWIPALLSIIWLLKGGLGLSAVPTDKIGGLPMTLMLSFIGLVCSYPLGILLALGRKSDLPLIRIICVVYIELIRGVPMISLLFMASVMVPLFFPQGISFPQIFRAQMAIIFFVSAYIAEVVRGGLASIPKGQYEAADALGLSYWQKTRKIILPQALKVVIPPTVNTVIGMFKDTSLVVIIAIFDLLMTTKTSVRDTDWLGFSIESYVFVAAIYFIFCFSMGRYSRRLERELSKGRTHE